MPTSVCLRGWATLPFFWADLPLYPMNPQGVPDVPITLAVVGSRRALLAASHRIGWTKADAQSPLTALHDALAALFKRSYPTAPVSRLCLFGRLPDLVVEHALGSVARRDHVRLWSIGRVDVGGGKLRLASISRDVSVEVVRRSHLLIGTSHHIDPAVDAARARLVHDLWATGTVASVRKRPGVGPTRDGQDASGDAYVTDGQVAVVVLRDP